MHAGDQRPGHGGDVGGGEPPTQQRVQPQLCPTRALHVSHLHLLCTGAFLFVPYSVLLISNKFCNGGSRAVMLLNRTGGVVWVLISLRSITRASGRGLGPGNLEFFGPQMALAYRLDAISEDLHASKTLRTGPYKS